MSYFVRNVFDKNAGRNNENLDNYDDEKKAYPTRPAWETGYELVGTVAGIYSYVANITAIKTTEDNSQYISQSSGILIGNRLVLTAQHVQSRIKEYGEGTVEINGKRARVSDTKVIRSDQPYSFTGNDIAVLKIEANLAPSSSLVGMATIDGDPRATRQMLSEARTAGFPGNLYATEHEARTLQKGSTETGSTERAQPIEAMFSLHINARQTGKTATWSDPNAVGAAGNSGGGLWVYKDGTPLIAGNFTAANATGRNGADQSVKTQTGVFGMLLTMADKQEALAFSTTSNERDWRDAPTDYAYFSDDDDLLVSTTFRSENIDLGAGNDVLLASGGEDRTDGGEGFDRVSYEVDQYASLDKDAKDVGTLDLSMGINLSVTASTAPLSVAIHDRFGPATHELTNVEWVTLSPLEDAITVAGKVSPSETSAETAAYNTDEAQSPTTPLFLDAGGGDDTFDIDIVNGAQRIVMIGGAGDDTFNVSANNYYYDYNGAEPWDGSADSAPDPLVIYGGEGSDTFAITGSANIVFAHIESPQSIDSIDFDSLKLQIGRLASTIVVINPDKDDIISWSGKTLAGASAKVLDTYKSPPSDNYQFWNYAWEGTVDFSGDNDTVFPITLRKETYEYTYIGYTDDRVSYSLDDPTALGRNNIVVYDQDSRFSTLTISGFNNGDAGISFEDYLGDIPINKDTSTYWSLPEEIPLGDELKQYFSEKATYDSGYSFYDSLNANGFPKAENIYINPIIENWAEPIVSVGYWDGKPAWTSMNPGYSGDNHLLITPRLSEIPKFVISGTDKSDYLYGTSGADAMFGLFGNDQLYGFDGHDNLSGDEGDDFLVGDSGDDLISGGEGIDSASYFTDNGLLPDGKYAGVIVDLNTGVARGAQGNDKLTSIEVVYGSRGSDQLTASNQSGHVLFGMTGDDQLIGGAGNDILYGNEDQDKLTGNLGSDALDGGWGDDILFGGADRDFLYGGEGNDFLDGDTGQDQLYGQSGDDNLYGDDGDDFLTGDEGNDTIDGGDGIDTASYINSIGWRQDGSYDGVLIDLTSGAVYGSQGMDRLINIEVVFGSFGSDTILGSNGDDTAHGSNGNDELVGRSGNDILLGQDGDDSIEGGSGNDVVDGGLGNDTFVFRGDFGSDYVMGFVAGSVSGDVIMLDKHQFSDLDSILSSSVQYGLDLKISLDEINSFTLANVAKSDLIADDFQFI